MPPRLLVFAPFNNATFIPDAAKNVDASHHKEPELLDLRPAVLRKIRGWFKLTTTPLSEILLDL